MKAKANLLTTICAALALAFSTLSIAQDEALEQILFTNVNVFDGRAEELQMGVNVLVEGNVIRTISAESVSAPGATVIAGEGRTLMPGLIDNHVHLMLNGSSLLDIEANQTWEDLAIVASRWLSCISTGGSRLSVIWVAQTLV